MSDEILDLTHSSDEDEEAVAPVARCGKREAVDLSLDSDEDAAEPEASDPSRAPKRGRSETASAAPRGDVAPAWLSRRGTPRIMSEFREIQSWEGPPRVYDAELVDDRADVWRFKVRDFDESCVGGRELNADLRKLAKTRKQDHILMEARFPANYPTTPFFLRCVSPRFEWYTGHVTAGGAICIEALTTDGSPNSWRATHCVEAILRTVFANMLHAEVTVVRTANGPGGRSGPLRVDLARKFGHDVLSEYSSGEAQAAFSRMLQHHRRNGW